MTAVTAVCFAIFYTVYLSQCDLTVALREPQTPHTPSLTGEPARLFPDVEESLLPPVEEVVGGVRNEGLATGILGIVTTGQGASPPSVFKR